MGFHDSLQSGKGNAEMGHVLRGERELRLGMEVAAVPRMGLRLLLLLCALVDRAWYGILWRGREGGC